MNPGHALIVPRRHVGSWFEATAEEKAETLEMVAVVRERIEAEHVPVACNCQRNGPIPSEPTPP